MDCTICGHTVHCKSRGLCKAHYARWLRYGDPLGGGRPVRHGIVVCIECGGPVRGISNSGVCTRTEACRLRNSRIRGLAAYRRNHARNIIAAARARARRSGAPFSLTLDNLPEVPDVCPILGIELRVSDGAPRSTSPSLDRKDPALGYVPGNIWWISHQANTMKSSADAMTLRRFAQWVLTEREAS